MYLHTSACKCHAGETVNVVCPLYPNPWTKKAWGPFTAFRVDMGSALFLESPHWRSVIASPDYAHFDEWWGPFHYTRGWDTMGDVLTRLAEDTGVVIMSKLKMPFAEAKTCRSTRLQVYTPASLHACKPTRLHVCTPASLHACTSARLKVCKSARLHACTPAGMARACSVRAAHYGCKSARRVNWW